MKRNRLNGLMAAALALLLAVPAMADSTEERRAAMQLFRAGEVEQALAAFEAIAAGATRDGEKADALNDAITCAVRLERYDKAMELAAEMPDSQRATNAKARVHMAQRDWKQVLALYGKEPTFEGWSADATAEAYGNIGTANYQLKQGEAAKLAFEKAVELEPNYADKTHMLLRLGDTYRLLLNEPELAVETYRRVYEVTENRSRQADAAVGIAAILLEQEKPDQALEELGRVDLLQLPNTFERVKVLRTRAEILAHQGKTDEAVAAYREALEHHDIHPAHKKACEEAIEQLQASSPAQ